MILRLAVSTFLIYDLSVRLPGPADLSHSIPEIGAAVVGVLLLAGLWTPVAGVLVSVLEIWISVAHSGDGAHILAAAIALGLSLIGPGAWSVDALVFGRRRILLS
jgi:uncharacterized membrane protein YphA (DoxX/SURF4 family)